MTRTKILGALLAVTSLGLAPVQALAADAPPEQTPIKHVLLISLDGFHPFDLDNYVASHPSSALASLVQRGVKYSNASSQVPSDSFPTTVAMVTGGSPATTGIYYDTAYSRRLSPPGSDCSTRGTTVKWKENLNLSKNSSALVSEINVNALPRDPDNGCAPFWPHQFLKVNDIYEVAHQAGMRTAVSDKHPAYEILFGPSGQGIDDFYSPEFNGAKKDIAKIMANDELKVDAVLNEINGYDHSGTQQVGVPAIFGMNFQTPNIAQKFSGYADPLGFVPNDIATIGGNAGNAPGLAQALDYVDGALGRMVSAIQANGLSDSTMIVVGAKHGNSPVDVNSLRLIDGETLYPQVIDSVEPGLAAQITVDTAALIWLNDSSRTHDVAEAIRANASTLGASAVYEGDEINSIYAGQLAGGQERRPDIIVDTDPGVIYSGPGSKLTEHGGFHAEDLEVALLVVNPAQRGGRTIPAPVNIKQIAPTILEALGLDPHALQAVQIEHTTTLPGLHFNGNEGAK